MAETIARCWEAIARGAATVRAQPDMGDAGQNSTEVAARSDAEGDAGRDDAEDTARPVARVGETGGDASKCPASQMEGEVPALVPTRAGDEGAAVAATMAQTAPAMVPVVEPVVEIPAEEISEAWAPGRLEDPWEVAAAAAGIASASEGGLGARPSEEPGREDSWVMVQSGIPPVFDRNERWEYEAWGEFFKGRH